MSIEVTKFADDTKIFRLARNRKDYEELQKDINKLNYIVSNEVQCHAK